MRLAVSGAIACGAMWVSAACSLVTNTNGLTGGPPSTAVDSGSGSPGIDAAPFEPDSALVDSDASLLGSDSASTAQDSAPPPNPDATADAPADAPGDAVASPLSYRDTVLADTPLAYWRFGESSGTSAQDETSNGHQASFGNGITFGASGAIVGDTNTAIHLDGTDGLSAGVQFDFAGNAPFSLEGWVRPEVIDNTYRHLFSKDAYPTTGREQYGVFLQATSAELLGFERWIAGSTVKTRAPLPPLNQWSYIVATYDGAQMTLYFNGTKIDQRPDTRSQLSKNTPEYVGCKKPLNGAIIGSLDEFAIYDQALTATRVGAHWAASGH